MSGLANTENENRGITCFKFGSLDVGKETSDYMACKSGIISDVSSEVCDYLEKEPVCTNGVITQSGKWRYAGIRDERTSPVTCELVVNSKGEKVSFFSEGSQLKSKIFADFLEEFNELDIEELNMEDKYASADNSQVSKYKVKWKLLKKYLIYSYAEPLRAADIIDDEGEIQEDKDCEFEFVMKYLG